MSEKEKKHKGGRPILAQVSMCKYRRKGVECPKYQRNCKECGWNPEVEAYRKWLLEKGYVTSFLKIDLNSLKKANQAQYRKHEKEAKGKC